MLTNPQRELLDFIVAEHGAGRSPSYGEMAAALGLKSRSGVHRIVGGLVERGFVQRGAGHARNLRIVGVPDMASTGSMRAAVSMVASGGGLSPASGERAVDFPAEALPDGTPFSTVRICGASYGSLSLHDGDRVVFAHGAKVPAGALVLVDDLARVDSGAGGEGDDLLVRYADGRMARAARDLPVAVALVRTTV